MSHDLSDMVQVDPGRDGCARETVPEVVNSKRREPHRVAYRLPAMLDRGQVLLGVARVREQEHRALGPLHPLQHVDRGLRERDIPGSPVFRDRHEKSAASEVDVIPPAGEQLRHPHAGEEQKRDDRPQLLVP